jgi:hypothetical protein
MTMKHFGKRDDLFRDQFYSSNSSSASKSESL